MPGLLLLEQKPIIHSAYFEARLPVPYLESLYFDVGCQSAHVYRSCCSDAEYAVVSELTWALTMFHVN